MLLILTGHIHGCSLPVSEAAGSSAPTDTPVAVTQQLLSSASLDGPASSSASAAFEPVKSDPSERECSGSCVIAAKEPVRMRHY